MADTTELRDLPVEEIESRLSETREELFNLRFQNATGQLDNYKRLGELRKEVARIKTVLRERELSASEGEG
jgi:large subunit ribosomal protein L29